MSSQRSEHAIADVATFRSVVTSEYLPIEVSETHPTMFRARLRNSVFADISITEVRARRHTMRRSGAVVSESGQLLKLCLQVGGSTVIHQNGRTATVHAGDMFLADPDVPYMMEFDDDMHLAYVLFPQRVTRLDAEEISELTARPIPGSDPLVRSIAPFFAQLPRTAATAGWRGGVRLANTAVELISTIALGSLEREPSSQRSRRDLLLREAKEYISLHLRDPQLTPDRIAAALFISTRYLHVLFQNSGTTVASWIQRQRLESARHELAAAHGAAVSITRLASDWGFAGPSQFSRAFRRAFGVAPSDVRIGS